MRLFWVLFMMLILSVTALPLMAKTQVKDPFYPAQTHTTNFKIKLPKLVHQQYCPQAKIGFLPAISIEQIKIVGVVQQNHIYKLLLMDENQHFLELQKGDFMALERMQLVDIQLGAITLKHWDYAQGCEQPQQTTIQL